MNWQTPDYLIIGHVTKDNLPNGAILGGTCSYSAITVRYLGLNAAIVTSAGSDIPNLDLLTGVALENIPAHSSTTFENIYQHGQRYQKWLATGQSLLFDHIPLAWQRAPIIHLAPMAQEISPALCQKFPESMVCVTIQGWLRGQDTQYNVIYQPHPDLDLYLRHADILVMSLADVAGQRDQLEHYMGQVKLGVETLGPAGCRLYHQGQVIDVPVVAQPEIDPTGAGDIFAATFFTTYWRTHDPIQAAQFANACASLSVRGVGLASIPQFAQVEAYWRAIYR